MPHIPLRLPALAAAATALLLIATPNAHADDDTLTLRAAAMWVDADTTLKGTADVYNTNYSFYESKEFDLSNKLSPRLEATFRFNRRNRLIFNYFGYDKTHNDSLGEQIRIGDVTFPAYANARIKTDLDIASFVYDFALIENDTNSLGLQIGAEWARIEATAFAEAQVGDQYESFSVREKEDGWAPVIGVRWMLNTSDGRWRLILQGQYLKPEWGNFDEYDGRLLRANLIGEYRFTQNFGIFVGYDWFDLDVSRDYYYDYGRFKPGLELSFKGPMAGVTLAF